MTDPVGDWTVVDPLVDLQPGVTYRVSGWTDDEAFSASGVEFTVDDLGKHESGGGVVRRRCRQARRLSHLHLRHLRRRRPEPSSDSANAAMIDGCGPP